MKKKIVFGAFAVLLVLFGVFLANLLHRIEVSDNNGVKQKTVSFIISYDEGEPRPAEIDIEEYSSDGESVMRGTAYVKDIIINDGSYVKIGYEATLFEKPVK